jgi:hypothetical protein
MEDTMAADSAASEDRNAVASADSQRTLDAPQFTGKYLSLESFKRDVTVFATPLGS